MMSNKVLITVLSPTYNKSKTIGRTFNSLLSQTCYDFEWLIVNDGSTDDSIEIANSFQTNLFPIRIINKKNEGLNRTFNRGVKEANGCYILRLDPDDCLTNDAIELVSKYINKTRNDEYICGVAFLTKFDTGEIIGTHPFDDVFRTNFFDYRYVYRAKGDRCEIVKKSILERYQMPEIEGEKFCRESYMWNCMAQEYDAIYVPKAIYIREYSASSISSNSVRVYSNNPVGMMLCNSNNVNLLIKKKPLRNYFMFILRSGINYFRFGLYSKRKLMEIFKGLPLLVSVICFLPGFFFYMIDHLSPSITNRIVRLNVKRRK